LNTEFNGKSHCRNDTFTLLLTYNNNTEVILRPFLQDNPGEVAPISCSLYVAPRRYCSLSHPVPILSWHANRQYYRNSTL